MSTYNITGANCTSFYGGVEQASTSCVGTTWDGNYNRTVVSRYHFKTDGYGATKISFQTQRAIADVNPSKTDNVGRMRFAIGTSATEHKTRKSSSVGYAISTFAYGAAGTGYLSGTLSIKLLPNTDYYLWIFPNENFSSYTRFNIGNCTVTTTGTYGTASTISAGNGTFGNSVTINLSNSVSGVTNTVSLSFTAGGHSYSVTTSGIKRDGTTIQGSGGLVKNSNAKYTWTPTLSEYGALITSVKSVTVTITCATSYGGASWGSKTKTVTMSFPDSSAPTIDSVTLSINNTGTAAAGFALYVQGYSKVSAAITASAKYSANIDSYAVTVNGTKTSGSISPVNSAVITGSGTVTVTLSVTDSRGFTTSTTEDITVEPYSYPQLLNVNVYRSDSDGTANESGSYLSAYATGNISSIDNINNFSIYLSFKKKVDANYGPEQQITSEVRNTISGTDANYTYDVKLRIVDSLGNETPYTVVINSQKWAMKFNADATAVGFGKAPELNKVLEIPSDWEIVRGAVPNEEHAAFVPPNEEMALKSDVVLKSDVPSMFSGMLSVYTVDSAALNISAGGTDAITASAAKTGYTPIGVVGWSLPGSGSSYAAVFRCYLSGTTLNASIRSVNAAITSQFRWYVLYRKNTY